MRGEIVGAVLAVLVVIGLGAGYLVGAGGRQTTTLTQTSTLQPFGTSTLTSFVSSTWTTTQTVVVTTRMQSTATSTVVMGSPIPIERVQTWFVSVGGSARTIAVNPNASRIYVADTFSSSLTIVDASSHSVVAMATLPAPNNNGIVIDSNTNVVYVLVQGGVAEVNGTSNKVVGELMLNFGAGSMGYNPTTHVIYGSAQKGSASGLVGADVRTGKVVMNISLGFWANSVAVDPHTNMIFAVGCRDSFVCGSQVAIVNGTSKTLLKTVLLDSAYYSRATINTKTDTVYVSGGARLVALSGYDGSEFYNSYPQTCGPFDSMAVIPSANQLLAISLNYNYVMVYNGATLSLVNMYSLGFTPQYVSFNPNTNEIYVTSGNSLLAFHNVADTGNVNSTLIGSGQNCLPV